MFCHIDENGDSYFFVCPKCGRDLLLCNDPTCRGVAHHVGRGACKYDHGCDEDVHIEEGVSLKRYPCHAEMIDIRVDFLGIYVTTQRRTAGFVVDDQEEAGIYLERLGFMYPWVQILEVTPVSDSDKDDYDTDDLEILVRVGPPLCSVN